MGVTSRPYLGGGSRKLRGDGHWNLELGVSLEVGVWCLEFIRGLEPGIWNPLTTMSTQPNWRRDYPIRQAEEHRVTRRQFAMFACCSAAVFGAAWLAKGKVLAPRIATEPKIIARTDEIPVGGSKLFRYPTEVDPCILIRLATDRFAAYSQSCTHLKCPVYLKFESNQLVCPCHEGS